MSWPPYTRVPRLVPIRPDQARSGRAKQKKKLISRPDSSRFIPIHPGKNVYVCAMCQSYVICVYVCAMCMLLPLFHVSVTLY